jgi:monoamine oxidase
VQRPVRSDGDQRVIVVGAGLAGLRCAHLLWTVHGIPATVYEGSDRAGGRCRSLRDRFAGYVVEQGGQFINTAHDEMMAIVRELGLSLIEVNAGNLPPGGDTYWMDGADYSYDDANDEWGVVSRAFRDALAAAPYPSTYASHTTEAVRLDRMTVDEWLDAIVPGGLSSRFARLMQCNAVSEYGLDPGEQSALNLVYLLGFNSTRSLDPLTGSDEKYAVAGGNDLLVSGMVDALPAGSLQLGHRLLAVRQTDSAVVCTLEHDGAVKDVVADRVVLALPFMVLRECELDAARFSERKLKVIRELDLGTIGKLHVGLSRRPWIDLGRGGIAYSDIHGHQVAWDVTVGQPLDGGVLVRVPGGTATSRNWYGDPFGPAPDADVARFLSQIEPIFPGTTAAYTGVSWRDAWHLNPWTKGAYTCPRPGQQTALLGIAHQVEGRVHFAGEHTSVETFSFMEGAVESGVRASAEVAAALG